MAAVILMNVDDDVLSLYNALGMAKDKLDIRNNNVLRLPGALSELFITVSIPPLHRGLLSQGLLSGLVIVSMPQHGLE